MNKCGAAFSGLTSPKWLISDLESLAHIHCPTHNFLCSTTNYKVHCCPTRENNLKY